MSTALLAPPSLGVSVTQKEIDTAIPKSSGHCMIADAVKANFRSKMKRKPIGVSVDLQTIRLTDPAKGLRYVYLTPATAQRALLQFDQGIQPTPFRFRLNSGQTIESEATEKAIEHKRNRGKSAAMKEQLKKARLAKAKKALKGGAKLVAIGRGKSHEAKQIKLGGRVPPASVLTGNRRQFGLKGLGDLNGPTGTVKPRRPAKQSA